MNKNSALPHGVGQQTLYPRSPLALLLFVLAPLAPCFWPPVPQRPLELLPPRLQLGRGEVGEAVLAHLTRQEADLLLPYGSPRPPTPAAVGVQGRGDPGRVWRFAAEVVSPMPLVLGLHRER